VRAVTGNTPLFDKLLSEVLLMKTSRRMVATLCVGTLLATTLRAQPTPAWERFEIDGAHSSITFSVPFMKLTDVSGTFENVIGAVLLRPGAGDGAVAFTVDASSINTRNARRDQHLRSADFFDTEQFHRIEFVSSSVMRRAADRAVIRGPLTLHGVTKDISVEMQAIGTVGAPDLNGSPRAAWVGRFAISRKDFGLTGGSKFNPGFNPLVIGDSVVIALHLQGVRALTRPTPGVDSLLGEIARVGTDAAVDAYASGKPIRSDSIGPVALRLAQTARRLQQEGRLPDAIKVTERNVRLHPQVGLTQQLLMELQMAAGQSAEARRTADALLLREPWNPTARAVRAVTSPSGR
jgi:polyisoprenoid-binding protein YceI